MLGAGLLEGASQIEVPDNYSFYGSLFTYSTNNKVSIIEIFLQRTFISKLGRSGVVEHKETQHEST